MRDLNDKGTKVIGFKEHGDVWKSDQELWRTHYNESLDQMTGFSDSLDRLKNAIEPYLSFHKGSRAPR